jgi:phospholipid/cholesterol/gamma-HCH transport system substrate-binding protein
MNLFRGHPVRAGLISLAGIAAVVLLAVGINVSFGVPLNVSLWPPGFDYTLKAAFHDANGVARGADVVVAGHSIGQVTGVTAQGRDSIVTMRIQRGNSPVPQGTVARIRYSTLLAQKYLELTPSSSKKMLKGGSTLSTDQTVTPVDFDQFLNALDPTTRQRLQTLIQEGGSGLSGSQQTVSDLLAQLRGLSEESRAPLTTFHQHDPDIDRILMNLSIVSGRLAVSREQLGQLVANMDDVMGTLAAHDRALASLILHLGNVSGDFNATLKGNEGNLHQTVITLNPLVAQLTATLGITAADLHANAGAINANTTQFMPEAGCCDGGATTDSDSEGNYLRELLIICPGYQTVNSKPSPSCLGAGGSGSTATAPLPAGGVQVPSLPAVPSCVPRLPTPSPPPTPKLSPTLCPSVSIPPLPLPSSPCLPTPPPTPKPTSLPSVCPSLPGLPGGLPSLPGTVSMPDWMQLILGIGQ